uniref:MOSC domain-containing protein n=1 Tax=Parastrongyloides trichosuri TaxID=131310 RepID=A0A0N4ZIZ3_PARTI
MAPNTSRMARTSPRDHAAKCDLALGTHGLTDDAEGLLRQRPGGREIIGIVPVEAIDLLLRHEALDVDRLGALELDRFDLLIGQEDVFVLGHGIAFDQGRPLDRARVRVGGDHPDTVVGLGIDEVEVNLSARAGGRVERDRAGDEREAQVSLPGGAIRHFEPPGRTPRPSRRINTMKRVSLPGRSRTEDGGSAAGFSLTVFQVDDEAVLPTSFNIRHEETDLIPGVHRWKEQFGVPDRRGLKARGLDHVAMGSSCAFGVDKKAVVSDSGH